MKSNYIQKLYDYFIVSKSHRVYRQPAEDPYRQAGKWSRQGISDTARASLRLRYVLEHEKPVVLPSERIALLRTFPTVPELHTEQEDKRLRAQFAFHENGRVFNMCPDYQLFMEAGSGAVKEKIKLQMSKSITKEQRSLLDAMLDSLLCMEELADRYRAEAASAGNAVVEETFASIPRNPPRSFLESLQFLRLLHYTLWCNGNYHNTLGRIDQYLYKYYRLDLDSGRLTKDDALELLEEFFISCNKDSDLYIGIQQGDNGQTVVLGGSGPDGTDDYNELSELCLIASRELCLIDPKINLRVHRNTPLETYELATTLTQKGLGFPQYTNDEIIIPALLKWGYDKTDAYRYTIAACWEILIPGYMDLVNWDSLCFPQAVSEAVERLESCGGYDDFARLVQENIVRQADALMKSTENVYKEPSPFLSLLCPDCLDEIRDISAPGKYNNYGFHGDGLSCAADSMAAVRRYVFDEKLFTAPQLIKMLHKDFSGYEAEQNILRYEAPKMGNNDDYADSIAVQLIDSFAAALDGHRNDRGGCFRPGTASAMYYIWHSRKTPATADGRNAGEPFSCNYSPSLYARCKGPVSIIKSFAKPHLEKAANGGPLTLELHDSSFRNRDALRKCAMFVKSYMELGGHQLQLNAVNRERLIDAQRHPESYKNLIVRVWGWSGYFVELDEVYQNHIIKRAEMTF